MPFLFSFLSLFLHTGIFAQFKYILCREYFNSWLIRILLNVCHDIQKRQKRVTPVETVPEAPPEPGDRSAELRAALFELDEKLRVPVILHYIDGYSVREVAKIMNISENAVKLRMLRGRKRLRELLTEEVFEE